MTTFDIPHNAFWDNVFNIVLDVQPGDTIVVTGPMRKKEVEEHLNGLDKKNVNIVIREITTEEMMDQEFTFDKLP